jgi:hypothetical protein
VELSSPSMAQPSYCFSLKPGCEALFVIQRDEHRLTLFENRVLRTIFVPEREVLLWDWRKLHNVVHCILQKYY